MMRLDVEFSLTNPPNFWELNPTVGLVPPFSKLYNGGKNKEYTSKVMWYLSFLFNPDETENQFAKMPEHQSAEILEATFIPELKKDTLFYECYNAFPDELLSPQEEAVNAALKALRQYNRLFSETELTLDETIIELDPNSGKKYAIQKKGTAKQIDSLASNVNKIVDKLMTALAELRAQKEKAKGIGGAYIPKSETMWDD